MKKTNAQLTVELEEAQAAVANLIEEVSELQEGMKHMNQTITMLKKRNVALVSELDEAIEAKVS